MFAQVLRRKRRILAEGKTTAAGRPFITGQGATVRAADMPAPGWWVLPMAAAGMAIWANILVAAARIL